MEDYFEIRAKVRIPHEKIQDLIITALEGACRYWASFKFPENWKEKYKFLFLEWGDQTRSSLRFFFQGLYRGLSFCW